ncbi:hypothetical protein EXIGLDRAFT_770066 [Exidia glandulosa HHB12029]|uniref:Protein transport protein SEC23 n=1 Tax=Exidia glandulosa HHB12029 TaxID=1314781 RepID=A0A165H0J7_EXIGL|nr:hypothetical protein EXIGLDRAFT_770066 [Exidia glandulosa HHB12029]
MDIGRTSPPTVPAQVPPNFLFVVDTCLDKEELKVLGDGIVVLIPPYALVGLITFGTMTQVHELGYAECSKSYVFRGGKQYSPKQIQDMLALSPQNRCEFQLTGLLECLQKDVPPFANDKCPLRCTCVALSVAVDLLESILFNTGARIPPSSLNFLQMVRMLDYSRWPANLYI